VAGKITVDFDPIRDALFDWLNNSVNKLPNGDLIPENSSDAIPIMRAESNYTRPDRGFLEYKFLTGLIGIGMKDELVFDEGADSFKLLGRRDFTITVTAFGEGSQECISQVQLGLSDPNICAILRAAGLAVRDKNTINDATVFQEEDHEQRQVMDVRFGICLEHLVVLDFIENVEIKNKIVDPAAGGPYTVTISKP